MGNLSDVLRKKQSDREEDERKKLEASKPGLMPKAGDIVLFYYGDPDLINTPVVELATMVTGCDEWGRVSGWAFVDPNATATGPTGEPIRVPPLLPVGLVSYSQGGEKLTWRWSGDRNGVRA